jgi:chitinase
VPSIDATVQAFRQAGIAPERLGIGVQVVGVDWQGGSGTDSGGVTRPCQSWDTSGTRANGQDSGAPDYSIWRFVDLADILRSYTSAQGFAEGYDDEAQAAWLGKDGLGAGGDRFVSFENAQSIADKAAYLRAQGLGGMIVFEISQDYRPEVPLADPADTDPQHPLLSVIREQVLQRD